VAIKKLYNASGRTIKLGEQVQLHASKKDSFDFAPLGTAGAIGVASAQIPNGSWGVIDLFGASVSSGGYVVGIAPSVDGNIPIYDGVTGAIIKDSGKKPSDYQPAGAYLVAADIANKVDKVTGKGLSTEDYTTAEKNKLAGISAGAETNVNAYAHAWFLM
jgi:hypothetical protein